jgi:hypothetical protein
MSLPRQGGSSKICSILVELLTTFAKVMSYNV